MILYIGYIVKSERTTRAIVCVNLLTPTCDQYRTTLSLGHNTKTQTRAVIYETSLHGTALQQAPYYIYVFVCM